MQETVEVAFRHSRAWLRRRHAFRMRVFPGGHLYLDGGRSELLADLAATLATLTSAPLSEASA